MSPEGFNRMCSACEMCSDWGVGGSERTNLGWNDSGLNKGHFSCPGVRRGRNSGRGGWFNLSASPRGHARPLNPAFRFDMTVFRWASILVMGCAPAAGAEPTAKAVDFERHVMGLLSKAGCN